MLPSRGRLLALVILAVALLEGAPSRAQEPILSSGQSIYVPVYSHMYVGRKRTILSLACTLSIRNTDPSSPITVEAVDYYDTHGRKIRSYLKKATALPLFGTLEYYLDDRETEGGSGANFVVRWSSPTPVNPPIVETVMMGVQGAQGISFTSRGQPIQVRR